MEIYTTFRSVLGREVAILRTSNAFAVEDNIVGPDNSPDKNVASDAEGEFERDIDGARPLQSVLRVTNDGFQRLGRAGAEVVEAKKARQLCRPKRGAQHICRTEMLTTGSEQGLASLDGQPGRLYDAVFKVRARR